MFLDIINSGAKLLNIPNVDQKQALKDAQVKITDHHHLLGNNPSNPSHQPSMLIITHVFCPEFKTIHEWLCVRLCKQYDVHKELLQDMAQFDYDLATKYSTDETTRRQYARSYNPYSVDGLQKLAPFLNWKTYFNKVRLIFYQLSARRFCIVSLLSTYALLSTIALDDSMFIFQALVPVKKTVDGSFRSVVMEVRLLFLHAH